MKLAGPAFAFTVSVTAVAGAQQPAPYPQQPYPAPQQPYPAPQQPYAAPEQPYYGAYPQPAYPAPQPVAPAPVAPQPATTAQPEAAPPEGAPAKRDVEGSVGLRVFGGGDHYTTPGGVSAGYDGLGFSGDAGGFGWGVGLYGEARFVQNLGVELGILYDHSELRRDVSYKVIDPSGTREAQIREQMIMKTWRLDLLVKGVIPFGAGRVWAGIGPEFVLSSTAEPSNTFTDGAQYFSASERGTIESAMKANEKKSVLLALGTGLVIHAGSVVEVPIELRVLRNLSQGSDWSDRVAFQSSADYTVDAQNTWEYRLGLGVGARF